MPSLADQDRRLLWHPYTQHGLGLDPLGVESAQGAHLKLSSGVSLIDAISSWWTNLHGHSHPKIARAIFEQALKLEHVLFAGFTHEPAVKLAEILTQAASKTGARLARVFYSDNGSTAVEAALKIAFQYHANRGDPRRTKFLALKNAYHGDTFGAMAASWPSPFNAPFRELLPEVDFLEVGNLPFARRLLEDHGYRYAALIVEPLVQGAAGMKMYPPQFLAGLAELCREQGILFICDEVFTGFYRTGTCFAFEQASVQPDLLCLSKGLAGGALPLAATLCTEEIFAAFKGDSPSRAFLHGHSFTANPLACAAALASWELLHEPTCQTNIQRITATTEREIGKLREHPGLEAARSLGTIGAVELKNPDKAYASSIGRRVSEIARAQGVLLRPLGNVVYAVPPYCVNADEMKRIYETLHLIADQLGESRP